MPVPPVPPVPAPVPGPENRYGAGTTPRDTREACPKIIINAPDSLGDPLSISTAFRSQPTHRGKLELQMEGVALLPPKPKLKKMKTQGSMKKLITHMADDFIDFGSISFTQHNTGVQAEFVLARGDVVQSDVAQFMKGSWGLKHPCMLLRAVGSIDPEEVDVENQEAVLKGIVYAVSKAKGFLLTNGLNFGLASLIGSCISRERHRCQCPLIGVASWASVQGREQIVSEEEMLDGVDVKGLKRKYKDGKPEPDMSTVSLQPVHTHFVLVKADESKLSSMQDLSAADKLLAARVRSFKFAHELEAALASISNGIRTPRVLMVVGGDSTTLREVLDYSRAGHGIVLIASCTGGLAAALAEYIRTGEVPEEWLRSEESFVELKEINASAGSKGGVTDRTNSKGGSTDRKSSPMGKASRMSSAGKANMWSLCTITDEISKDGIMDAVLEAAMIQAEEVNDKIRFAVEWHDEQRLNHLLGLVPAWVSERATILRDALQLSLELQHERCVEVCVSHAAPVKQIDLLVLYDQLFDESNPPIIYVFKGWPRPTDRLRKWKDGLREDLVNLDDPIYNFYPVEVWRLLGTVVPGLCAYWRKKTGTFTVQDEVTGEYRLADPSINPREETGPRWLDIYMWAVLYGKNELALKLLPACREPMRAAVLGARLCSTMGEMLPLHAVSLREAGEGHEAWALGLLDLTESFEEAWRMLVTKSRVWSRPLLHMAVQSDLRNFCCHVQCQLLGDEWLNGNSNFDSASVVLNGSDFTTLRMLVHMFVPINPPFMKRMLAWRYPVSLPDAEIPQGEPPFYAYYGIPQVKYMVRFTSHLLFTLLVSYATLETPMTWFKSLENSEPHGGGHFVNEEQEFGHDGGGLENGGTDLLLWVWTFALVLDEVHKYAQSPSTFVADIWNKYDYMTFSIVLSGLIVRFFQVRRSVEIECFAVIMVWCRLFKYLQLDYNLGVLVIILMRMTKDIMMWFTLCIIVLLAFTVTFVSIANPYVIEDSGEHPLTAPLWAMLGAYDVGEFQDWNPSIGKPMLWLYLVFTNIVLVNLLIAMMGYTFSEVKEQADKEWKFGRLRSIIEVNERFSATPPPLNMPLTLVTTAKLVWDSCCKPSKTDADEADESADDSLEELKKANKEKGKVARKLLFAMKRKEEDEAETIVDEVIKTYEMQREFSASLMSLHNKLDELDSKSSLPKKLPAPLSKPPNGKKPASGESDSSRSKGASDSNRSKGTSKASTPALSPVTA